MSTNKQALREEFQSMQDYYSDPADRERQLIYIAAEALLDELEALDRRNAELNSTLERWATDRAKSASELDDAERRIAELGGHLKSAHEFIENTEAFGYEAAKGILKCGDSEWNVDASKESLAAAGITVKGE